MIFTNTTMKEIFTNNEGILEIIEPFNYLRGIENRNECMGKAKNKEGKVFDIYPDECGLENDCFCGAIAK